MSLGQSPRIRAQEYWTTLRDAQKGQFKLPPGDLHKLQNHLDGLEDCLTKIRLDAEKQAQSKNLNQLNLPTLTPPSQ